MPRIVLNLLFSLACRGLSAHDTERISKETAVWSDTRAFGQSGCEAREKLVAHLCNTEASRYESALRLPVGVEGNAAFVGGAERPIARSIGEAASHAGGGSPDRLCKF